MSAARKPTTPTTEAPMPTAEVATAVRGMSNAEFVAVQNMLAAGMTLPNALSLAVRTTYDGPTSWGSATPCPSCGGTCAGSVTP